MSDGVPRVKFLANFQNLFPGAFSTSPSSANLAPGYSSTVESGSSEVLHISLSWWQQAIVL